MSTKTCKDCRHFVQKDCNGCCTLFCDTTCDDNSACIQFAEPTVFDKITESPDVLAPLLVLVHATEIAGTYYASMIAYGCWKSKAEAIAVTQARLKEVV